MSDLTIEVKVNTDEMILRLIHELGMNTIVNSLIKLNNTALLNALTEEVNDGNFSLEMLVGQVVVSRMSGMAQQKNHDMNKESD